jgi:hypothetical protein
MVINLGAWNAHPFVIQAIKERIDEIKNSSVSKSLSESAI